MQTLSAEEVLELKRRLARLLVEKSYREGDFVLASGRRSDYYFDCRVTALHAEGSWLLEPCSTTCLAKWTSRALAA